MFSGFDDYIPTRNTIFGKKQQQIVVNHNIFDNNSGYIVANS